MEHQYWGVHENRSFGLVFGIGKSLLLLWNTSTEEYMRTGALAWCLELERVCSCYGTKTLNKNIVNLSFVPFFTKSKWFVLLILHITFRNYHCNVQFIAQCIVTFISGIFTDCVSIIQTTTFVPDWFWSKVMHHKGNRVHYPGSQVKVNSKPDQPSNQTHR